MGLVPPPSPNMKRSIVCFFNASNQEICPLLPNADSFQEPLIVVPEKSQAGAEGFVVRGRPANILIVAHKPVKPVCAR